MRILSGPPGPSIMHSRMPATSAAGAINAMRASYWVRATSTGKVCVAGTPVPLSSSARICGSSGIRALFCNRRYRRCGRRQKAVEHAHSAAFVAPRIVLAVEHQRAIDEDAVHANRVAQRPRTATGQVVNPTRRRDADRCRIEQQQIGAGAGRDAAAIRNTVEPGLMTGQPAHAFDKIERAALAHPVAEEIEAKPGVAQIDEMRPSVGQRNDSGVVLDQRLDSVVDGVEEPPDKPGLKILGEAEIKKDIERVASDLARDLAYGAVGEPGVFRLGRRGNNDPFPVALEDRAGFRVMQVVAEALAPARVAEHCL